MIGLESALSLCAIAGGVLLLARPVSALPLRYLHGTWFETWRWPGVALLVFVGICPLLAIVATLQRRTVAAMAHIAVGAGLIAWIVLEAVWIVTSPGLQVTFALVGVVILILGLGERSRN